MCKYGCQNYDLRLPLRLMFSVKKNIINHISILLYKGKWDFNCTKLCQILDIQIAFIFFFSTLAFRRLKPSPPNNLSECLTAGPFVIFAKLFSSNYIHTSCTHACCACKIVVYRGGPIWRAVVGGIAVTPPKILGLFYEYNYLHIQFEEKKLS